MNYFRRVKGIAKSDGMPERLAELIAAQCAHETKYFTSNVFRKCRNLNGYKWFPPHGSRLQTFKCTLSPEGNAYGGYDNIEDSVHELVGWIKRRIVEGRFPYLLNIHTPMEYAIALKKCGYYEDPIDVYANGIKRALGHYKANN